MSLHITRNNTGAAKKINQLQSVFTKSLLDALNRNANVSQESTLVANVSNELP